MAVLHVHGGSPKIFRCDRRNYNSLLWTLLLFLILFLFYVLCFYSGLSPQLLHAKDGLIHPCFPPLPQVTPAGTPPESLVNLAHGVCVLEFETAGRTNLRGNIRTMRPTQTGLMKNSTMINLTRCGGPLPEGKHRFARIY